MGSEMCIRDRYSVFDSSKEERVAFIREHYSVVIGSNAINVVKKYM